MTSEKKPNIIFITLDACRPDHLGYMGYKKKTSPFLDSLAKEGTFFTRAFSTGPGSPHSFVSIFTSTFPFDYGGFDYIDRPRVLLSEVLQKNGYFTAAVHSAAYMSSFFGYDRGWDEFRYLSHFKGDGLMPGVKPGTWQTRVVKKFDAMRRFARDKILGGELLSTVFEKIAFGWRKIWRDLTNYTPPFFTADEINEEVKKVILRTSGKPIFLWIHYMDSHGPYGLPLKKGKKFLNQVKFHLADFIGYFFGKFYFINKWFLPLYKDLYDSGITYADLHIKKLFEHLTSINILNDESVVIFCADHGEEFLERGWVGHNDSVWNVNLNVPLFFYSKNNMARGKVIERPVSLIDFSPTVLDLVGLPKESAFKGMNIFSEASRPIIGQVPDTDTDLSNQTFLGASVIYEGYKLIHMKGKKKMLFSMEDDFSEKNNLYDNRKDLVEKLEKIIAPYESILPTK